MTQPSHKATARQGNFATLREDSPFYPFFEHGRVPIMNQVGSIFVHLEGSSEREVYFVDWTALTIQQRALVGNKVVEMRGGTFREFMKHMADGGRLPIRVSQTTSVSFLQEIAEVTEGGASK